MAQKLLLLTLTLVLLLAACTGPSSAAPASGPASAAAPAASSQPDSGGTPDSEAPKESDLDYVKGKGSLIIGYTVYAPVNYTDEQGNFTGFDTELARATCEKLGLTPEFVEINWDTKEIELAAKSIDCVWNGLTINEERKANMEITVPYVKNAQVVVMKADAEYTDTSSLIGKTVCAEAGSAGEGVVQSDANLVKAEYIVKDVQTACLMEVASGTADAAVLDLNLANAMIGEGTDYAGLAIRDRLLVENYGVAFRKGSELCEEVNKVFADLKADGTMTALAEKYGLDLA